VRILIFCDSKLNEKRIAMGNLLGRSGIRAISPLILLKGCRNKEAYSEKRKLRSGRLTFDAHP
jgi:hypothetical protein